VAAPIARDVMVHLLENEPAAASAPPVNADIGEIL
jgi:hypothetical protein